MNQINEDEPLAFGDGGPALRERAIWRKGSRTTRAPWTSQFTCSIGRTIVTDDQPMVHPKGQGPRQCPPVLLAEACFVVGRNDETYSGSVKTLAEVPYQEGLSKRGSKLMS